MGSLLRFMETYGLFNREEAIKEQNNKCALCGDEFGAEKLESAVLDHNHRTGNIRDLIHQRCNLMLGFAKDGIFVAPNHQPMSIFEAAQRYIEKHSVGWTREARDGNKKS